jgi:release factor glutamine methyltransferase
MIYEPCEDSYLILNHIKDYAKGDVLDLGTGSGILAEEVLKYSKNVLAVDINPESVDYCRKKGINAIQSDLFESVKGRFDLIIFNPPYLPEYEGEDEESKLVTTGGKEGYEITERFLRDAKNFLNKGGKILLISSSLTGDVEKLFIGFGYNFIKLETLKVFFEEIYLYLLC